MENPTNTPTYKFPKAQKLWGETSVDRLFEQGKGFSKFPLRVVYLAKEDRRSGEAPLRMMVSVGKKRFKRAVKRNRVKRLVREAWRLHKAELEQALAAQPGVNSLYVAFVFIGKVLPTQDAITASVEKSIAKLIAALAEGVTMPNAPAEPTLSEPTAAAAETLPVPPSEVK